MLKTDEMAIWWQSPLGQYVFEQEQAALLRLKSHFQGYFHLQVYGEKALMPKVNIPNHQFQIASSADLNGSAESLPIKSHGVDCLLLPHVLEFSVDPHQVLREAERVLHADGSLVLCCFNPFSLWGLKRILSWQDQPPWHGYYFSRSRVKDWLALLNFDVVAVEKLVFKPPMKSTKWLNRLNMMEQWGKRLWPALSVVIILVAKQRTVPLTPVDIKWRARQLFPPGRLVKPVTGYNKHPQIKT